MRYSVVIPLYNKEPFIKRALASVLAQTYRDFEVVIVDDGSTDSGYEIANGLVAKFASSGIQLKLFRQENSGASVARNRGINESSGAFVAFLDADDEWLPEFLAEIDKLTELFPDAGLYTTGFLRLDDITGSKQARIAKKRSILEFKPFVRKDRAILATEYVMREPAGKKGRFVVENLINGEKSDRISTSATAVRRGVFDIAGMFKPGVRIAQDGEMWLRIAIKYDFAYSQRILSINHTDDAVSTTKRLKMNLSNPPNAPILTAHALYDDPATPPELKEKLRCYLNIKAFNYMDRLYQAGYLDEARRVFKEFLIEPVDSWRKPFLAYKLFGTPLPPRVIPHVARQYWRKIAVNALGTRVDANGVWNRRYLIT